MRRYKLLLMQGQTLKLIFTFTVMSVLKMAAREILLFNW